MISFGNVPAGSVLPIMFTSYAGATGASVTMSGLAVTDIEVYKGTSMTQRASDAGFALLDTDGIDVVQLGGSCKSWTGVTSAKVDEMFNSLSPRGSTPLAEALTDALQLAGKSAKKDFIIVFTDGTPDDPVAAANVIKRQANSQAADDDCTILFVQVGDDRDATAYLRSLDDDLKGAKFDIVDAKTMVEADAFASTSELVVAAIND